MPGTDITGLGNIDEKKIVIWLEEYKLRTTEINACIAIQQQIINFELLAIGALISIGYYFFRENKQIVKMLLLLCPFIMVIFSWSFMAHDRTIILNSQYNEQVLRKQLGEAINDERVLQWEAFLKQNSKIAMVPMFPLLDTGLVLPFSVSLLCIIFYFYHFIDYFRLASYITFSNCWLLFDAIMLAMAFSYARKTVRLYSSITKG